MSGSSSSAGGDWHHHDEFEDEERARVPHSGTVLALVVLVLRRFVTPIEKHNNRTWGLGAKGMFGHKAGAARHAKL